MFRRTSANSIQEVANNGLMYVRCTYIYIYTRKNTKADIFCSVKHTSDVMFADGMYLVVPFQMWVE